MRRHFLVDTVPVGLGATGEYWVQGRFIIKTNRNNARQNFKGYKQDIKNGLIKYQYFGLTREQSLRHHLVHGLSFGSYGVYKKTVRQKFQKTTDLFNRTVEKIKNVLIFSNGRIFLRDDYEKILPFKTKNKEINYFIFSFKYLYSEEDQEKLILWVKKVKKYKNDNK